MDSVLRAAVTYVFLYVVVRISGRRTLGEMSTFDFILLLIISEATQQALIDDDNSITNSWLVIVTLVGMDILLAWAKQRWSALDRLLEGVPTILMKDGRLLKERMDKARVDEGDILSSARAQHGIGTMAEIEHAVLEKNGNISIIPRRP